MDSIAEKLSDIKLFLFDLQGVLLSESEIKNGIINNTLAEKLKSFNSILDNNGLYLGLITGSSGPAVTQLSSICNCSLLEGSVDKVSQAEKLLVKYSLKFENVFYIGDSILDLPLLQKVGLSSSPEDSDRKIKRRVDFVCPGSNGIERLNFLTDLLTNHISKK